MTSPIAIKLKLLSVILNPKNFYHLIRLTLKNDVSSYYTWLGNDVVGGVGRNDFQDLDYPLWMNLGYWKDARTYPEACTALAAYLADAAQLGAEDTILDVGFGFAEQDIFWSKKYHVQHIHGLNITPLHVEVGKKRVEAHQLSNRINLQWGSATEIPFPENSFDKVIALECAFHFQTRADFFKEAFRVLRPGGILATTDMLPLENLHPYNRLSGWLTSRHAGVPRVNMYNRKIYSQTLSAHGFVNIGQESIRNYVYPGMFKYINARYLGQKMMEVVIDLTEEEIAQCHGVWVWEKSGISDYVVFTAVKPFLKT